jgi:preprotein translocase subunit SecE
VRIGWTRRVLLAARGNPFSSALGEDMATQTRDRSGSGAAAKRDRTTPALFTRQVVAELRKVIWPTRHELGTYTAVALTFIIFMIIIVTSLDYGFTKLVFWFFT